MNNAEPDTQPRTYRFRPRLWQPRRERSALLLLALLILLCHPWAAVPVRAGEIFPIPSDSLFQLLFGYRCASPTEADTKMRAILFNYLWNFYSSEAGMGDLKEVAVHVDVAEGLDRVRLYERTVTDSMIAWLSGQGISCIHHRFGSEDSLDEYLSSVRRNVDRGLDSAVYLWGELQRYRPSVSLYLWINNRSIDSADGSLPGQWESSITLELSQRAFLERDFLWGPTSCEVATWTRGVHVKSARGEHAEKVLAGVKELMDRFAESRSEEADPFDSK